jgi:carboxylesterase
MIPLVLAAVLAAVIVWRVVWRSYVERSVSARLLVGADGIVPGAEAIDLCPAEPVGGMLLLHGFGDTPQTFAPLAKRLYERGFAVYAPLLPGHGRTLRDFRASNEAQWVAEARRALHELRSRDERVGVVGLSMGGALAVLLAAQPSDVRALVLLAPYLEPPPSVRLLARISYVAGWLVPYIRGGDPRSIYDPVAHAAALSYRAVTPRAIAELVRLADRARSRLAGVQLPTLYVQSTEDYRIPAPAAERSFDALGASEKRFEWLTDCGHVITVDYCREKVEELVTGWMGEHLDREPPHRRLAGAAGESRVESRVESAGGK